MNINRIDFIFGTRKDLEINCQSDHLGNLNAKLSAKFICTGVFILQRAINFSAHMKAFHWTVFYQIYNTHRSSRSITRGAEAHGRSSISSSSAAGTTATACFD